MKKTLAIIFAAALAANCANAQNWLTTGNSGLAAANFLGTTDAVALTFKVNNKQAGKIEYASSKAGTSYGFQTFKSNTGAGNSAFGYQAMLSNTTGFANTAAGQLSLLNNVSGNSNTAYGSQSLQNNISGFYNTAVGQASLAGSKGNDNTAVGRFSFVSLTTGSGNTAIGSGANVSDSTLSNVTLLGFLTVGTASNSVQIGNSSVTSVKAANNVVIVSDGRFKKNLKQNVPGLAFINALNPVTYNYDIQSLDKFKGVNIQSANANDKDLSNEASRQYADAVTKKEKVLYSGFVAQDVEKAAGNLGYDFSGVYKPQNDKDAYGLSYAEFVVPLVKAVQELSTQNDALKSKTEEQQQINTDLQKQINELKAGMQTNAASTIDANAKISANNTLRVSPNPAKNQINVSGLSAGNANYMELVDLNGRSVLKQKAISTQAVIDLSAYTPGIYILRYFNGNKWQQVKLVKE